MQKAGSIDERTVKGFGHEWTKFDRSGAGPAENERLFTGRFRLSPWDSLPPRAIGFDLGCGSGRWARMAVAGAGVLVGVDASANALRVAARNAPTCPLVRVSDEAPYWCAVGSKPGG